MINNDIKYFVTEKNGRWVFYNIQTNVESFNISKNANPKEKLIRYFGKEIVIYEQ